MAVAMKSAIALMSPSSVGVPDAVIWIKVVTIPKKLIKIIIPGFPLLIIVVEIVVPIMPRQAVNVFIDSHINTPYIC